MKYILTLILILTEYIVFSQSTIKVMQYNLLYYGGVHYDCDNTTNNVDTKNNALKTILSDMSPEADVMCVNEMDENEYYSDYLLDNVFKADGSWWWKRADTKGSWSINQIFYNSQKMGLAKHTYRYVYPGLVDYYKMYFKTQDLATLNDTIFITFVVIHLKAGSDTDDATSRADAVKTIMADLASSSYSAGNYLLMGDFNLYSSSEEAYQYVTNYSDINYKFFDPVDASWSNIYQTQSTHEFDSPCYSYGGMDDRFDFILMSNAINTGSEGISYKSNSYNVFGQDGNHYNQSINDGTNSVVSATVADALYTMSDHLPVTVELNLAKTLGVADNLEYFGNFSCNTVVDDILRINLNNNLNDNKIQLQIININGQIIKSIQLSGRKIFEIDMRNIGKGLYFVRLAGNNIFDIRKIVKN